MLRVSDLKNSSARFSSTIEMPSVASRMFSSLPCPARLITMRCRPYPKTNMPAITIGSATYGSTPSGSFMKYTAYSATIRQAPWAKLMMCSTP